MSNENSDSKVIKLSSKNTGAKENGVREKIKTLDELEDISNQARAAGKSVVLAHGVFDLIHVGHIRHLETARREGDVLIVTVTSDAYVNKGPDRPVFSETLRAEMIAALENVDWVGINHGPSAEPVINCVRPDVYVKGSDYENHEDDISGKIEIECKTVEKHGGRVVFTNEVTFSSTSLFQNYPDAYKMANHGFLDSFRQRTSLPKLLDLIESIKEFKVLIVGDTIIDEYQYVKPIGKPTKEMMIATSFQKSELFAGGVIAAANHVSSFCKEVEVITALGNADSQEELVRKSLQNNVRLTPIHRDNVPTTRKIRFVESGYTRKLFEVYHMDDTPFDDHLNTALSDIIAERAGAFDLVLVNDFGHGLISQHTISTLIQHAKFLAVSAQTNAGNHGFNLISKYPKADYVCIDSPEARLAVADKYSDLAKIASEALPGIIDCENVIITHGRGGCVTYSKKKGVAEQIPAFTNTVVDTVGAGDAFFTISAPLVAAGGNINDIGFIGNVAGALMVNVVGHRKSIDKSAVIEFLTNVFPKSGV